MGCTSGIPGRCLTKSPEIQFQELYRLEAKTLVQYESTDNVLTHAYLSVLSRIVRLGSKLAVCVG